MARLYARLRTGWCSAYAGRIACAHGSDLAFAPGAYVPDSGWGREIIGHELAHVLQQRYGRVRPGGFDPVLEAEAMEAGRRVAGSQPVRIPGGPRRGRGHGRAVAQFYAVHPAAPGAPFVVAGGGAHHAPVQAHDSFIGQVKAGGGSSFMTGAPPTVRLAATNPAAVTLRVSGNNEIAIEDCDLGLRQPKCFYATQAVIDASNNRLTLVGSAFRLVRDPVGPNQQRITVGGNTLYRVLPQDVASGVTGTAMQCVQPCKHNIHKLHLQIMALPVGAQLWETPQELGAWSTVSNRCTRPISAAAVAADWRPLPPSRLTVIRPVPPSFQGESSQVRAIPWCRAASGFLVAGAAVPYVDRRQQSNRVKEFRSMRMHRSVTALAVAMAGTTAIALAPGTAYASTGGGCGTNGPLKACISASGSNVEPDFYITAPTPGCTYLHAQVDDDTTGVEIGEWNETAPCGPIGHFGPWPFAGKNGDHYSISVAESGGDGYLVWSPDLVFSN